MYSRLRLPFTRFARTKSLVGYLAVSVAAAYAQPSHVQLPAPAQGAAAISALGLHLPAVAKAYGLQSQQLVTLFQTQPSLGVDIGGALLFSCEGLAVASAPSVGAPGQVKKSVQPEGSMATNTSQSQFAAGATVDALKLHSLPGVNRVIYLDFTGHTTSGTSWNSAYTGGAPIVSAPFDLDGSPSTFNSDERGIIHGVWQRIAEDYAPFGVDVTTEDPGVEALRRSSSSDLVFGIRAVISPSNWYKSSAGGVAYVGSFGNGNDTPCFIFTGSLANSDRYFADATSHEVGHTLGLYHDGATGAGATEYYQGHGDWAPIMGVSYYRGITQFSRGEYANANNTQDDFAVIANYVPLAGDDHGNALSSASFLAGPTVANGGTIERQGDVDLFRIDSATGFLSLAFQSPPGSPNLDLKAELLNSSGNVLQSSDPAGMAGSLSMSVNAGTYYVRVSGVGAGDPQTTGYSTYGSVGNYVITGTFPSATGVALQAPQAVATISSASGTAPLTVSFSGQGSSDPDGTIVSYQWSFGTAGATAVGATASYTYTSSGNYTAVLTVVDNNGLSSSQSVSINVAQASNASPVAIATASTTSGVAPVAIEFSGGSSYDSDGRIASYSWNFGDGTSSTAASPSKTFSAGGTYSVRLTVTDDRGATASSTLSVSVSSNVNTAFQVPSLQLATTTSRSGSKVEATVSLRDSLGQPAVGATVTIQWSGVISGSTTGKTDANGNVVISSAKTRKSGIITATLTSGYSEPVVRSVVLP